MPFILLLFPVMMKWANLSRTADVIILGLAAIISIVSCLLSLRHHHNDRPLSLVVIGITINLTGRFGVTELGPWLAQTLVISGPMLMAYGLWRDRQLCKCHLLH